jgi:hypothetical protein
MNNKDTSGRVPVIINLGMGVESSAILVKMIEDPSCRDFDLADVVVITAMTGDEFPDTGELVERHVLPVLRAHKVRYVQLARKAATVEKGGKGGGNYVVLSDSRETEKVYLAGHYKLSDEMFAAGTMPTTAGDRKCSIKSKGEVIDAWIVNEFLPTPESPFRQLIGFNLDEGGRADDDREASKKRKAKGQMVGRTGEFPLITWGWTREKCLEFLLKRFGVEWPKSCCSFCPFAAGREEVRARFRKYPELAAEAIWMEHLSLGLNTRLKLYNKKSVLSVLKADGNAKAVELFEAKLNNPDQEWVVYRVRRLYRGVGLADRHVGILARGSRADMESLVRRLGAAAGAEAGLEEGSIRAQLRHRADPPKRKKGGPKVIYKGVEEMLVALPRVAREKSAQGWTEEKWDDRVSLAMAGETACGVG